MMIVQNHLEKENTYAFTFDPAHADHLRRVRAPCPTIFFLIVSYIRFSFFSTDAATSARSSAVDALA